MAFGFDDILGGASLVGSLFGGSEEGTGTPGSSQGFSGYYALPKQAQTAYDNYFNLVNQLGTTQVNPFPMTYVQKPMSPFDSQELYNLQQANPNTPIRPTGFLEPFNQYQRAALSAMGSPDYSMNGLSQYLNPYQQMVQQNVINTINRQSDIDRSRLMDNASRLNSRVRSSSALGTQLAQNTEAKNRLLADAVANLGYQGYNEALNLRNQSLQQQLAAGGAIQQQNQQLLNAANPQGQFSLNPAYIQASLLGPLFGAFPQSSQNSQIGAIAAQPSTMSRLGGLGLSIFGDNVNNLSNNIKGLFG